MDVKVRSHNGTSQWYNGTPLLCAATSSHKDVFNLLLYAGANVDARSNDERTVLHYASKNGSDWIEIVLSLVKRVPALINARDKLGNTALHYAVLACSLETVKCLVKAGVDINVRNNNGATPLLYAAKEAQRDIFDLLLFNGADVDVWFNFNNRTVLHWVTDNGPTWMETLRVVVKKASDLNARDILGDTALHTAVLHDSLELVEYLVEEGVDINVRNDNDETPLLIAADELCIISAELLLNRGANVDGCDCQQNTILHHAARNGWLGLVQSLVKRLPDIDARNCEGSFSLPGCSVQTRNSLTLFVMKNC